MSSHHPYLPPSSFPAFFYCPCYRSGQSGEAAERGTVLHRAYLEQHLKGLEITEKITIQEGQALQYCDNEINAILEDNCVRVEDCDIEKKIKIYDDRLNVINYGSMDFGHKLFIVDLKFGQFRDYRKQMICYALGQMQRHNVSEIKVYEIYGALEITKEWSVTIEDAKKEFFEIVSKVDSPDKKPIQNRYCTWCRYKYNCSARRNSIRSFARGYFIPDNISPQEAGGKLLSNMVEVVRCIEPWCKDVKKVAVERLKSGKQVGIQKLKKTQGRMSIDDAGALVGVHGIDQQDVISSATVSISKAVDIISEKNGWTKKSSKDMLIEEIQEHIKISEPTFSLK